jgi:hypothetical protein
MLFTETVEDSTLELIRRLTADPELNDFLLVGGTALSLLIGHRKSVDVDLFTHRDFDAHALARHLKENYQAKIIREKKNSMVCFIQNVKLDILTHAYPLIKPKQVIDGIRMPALDEIGAMKLHAVFQSGKRLKDFVDMYFLLEARPFQLMAAIYEQKYPDTNIALARNSLLFHEQIEKDDGIELLKPDPGWPRMAERFRQAIVSPLSIFQPYKKGPKQNKGLRP